MNVSFVFYATNSYAKERVTEKITEYGLPLPDQAILKLLFDKNYSHLNLLACVKKLTIEYAKESKSFSPANQKTVEEWEDKDWLELLGRIEWQFSQEDSNLVESRLIGLITNSRFNLKTHFGMRWLTQAQSLKYLPLFQSQISLGILITMAL